MCSQHSKVHLERPGLSQKTASVMSVRSTTKEGIAKDKETKGLLMIILCFFYVFGPFNIEQNS